jgi:CheY-like chemotaxis protein/TolA-binding protein
VQLKAPARPLREPIRPVRPIKAPPVEEKTENTLAKVADAPSILLVGKGEPFRDALEQALERHGMAVEKADPEAITETVFAAAPDLVVLLGDAASDQGRDALTRLANHPATAVVPVVLLSDDVALHQKLRAFRHGAVAVVKRSASADEMARRIAELGRELPERPGAVRGELSQATADELVELFQSELRQGILSVSSNDGRPIDAQVVLRADRPVNEVIRELVDRIRPMLAQTSSLEYEFHETPRLQLLDADTERSLEDDSVFKGRRVLLVEANAPRADAFAQELRARGALVVVTDPDGVGLDRARATCPEVVIVDAEGLETHSIRVMRLLRRDVRMRWASMLVVRWNQMWPAGRTAPDIELLVGHFEPLVRPDAELVRRARQAESFHTRLEIIGPERTLRALAASGETLHVSVREPRAAIEVDLAEGLVVGATGDRLDSGDAHMEGPIALAALLVLSSGRVHVERRAHPSAANIMMPVDDALAMANEERSPIQPSVPPGSVPPTLSEAKSIHPSAFAPAAENVEAALRNPVPREFRSPPELPAAPVEAPSPPALPVVAPEPVELVAEDPRQDPTLPDSRPRAAPVAIPAFAEEAPARPSIPKVVWFAAAGAGAFVVSILLVVIVAVALGGDEEIAVAPVAPTPSVAAPPASTGGEEAAPVAMEEAPLSMQKLSRAERRRQRLEERRRAREEARAAREARREAARAARAAEQESAGGEEPDDEGPNPEETADANGTPEQQAWFHLNQGNYRRNQGRFAEAEQSYLASLRAEPGRSRAMVGLVRTNLAQRDYESAVHWGRRLVRARPRRAEFHVLLGDAYRQSGDQRQANASYRRALRLEPRNREARARLSGR